MDLTLIIALGYASFLGVAFALARALLAAARGADESRDLALRGHGIGRPRSLRAATKSRAITIALLALAAALAAPGSAAGADSPPTSIPSGVTSPSDDAPQPATQADSAVAAVGASAGGAGDRPAAPIDEAAAYAQAAVSGAPTHAVADGAGESMPAGSSESVGARGRRGGSAKSHNRPRERGSQRRTGKGIGGRAARDDRSASAREVGMARRMGRVAASPAQAAAPSDGVPPDPDLPASTSASPAGGAVGIALILLVVAALSLRPAAVSRRLQGTRSGLRPSEVAFGLERPG